MRLSFLVAWLAFIAFAPALAQPQVGEVAPEFTLKSVQGRPYNLTTLRRHKPVVLVFGSYT